MEAAEQERVLREAVTPEERTGTELARGAMVNVATLIAANLCGVFTFLVACLVGLETWGTISCFLAAIAFGLRDLAPVVGVLIGAAAGGLVAFFLARSLVVGAQTGPGERGTASLVRFSAPIAIYGLLNLLIMRMDVL